MSAQCDSTRWNFPLLPAGPRNLSHHFGATCSPDSATGGCPPPSLSHISERTPLSNEEAPFPQVLTALFRRVLRKKHAAVNGSKLAFCLSQSRTNTALFSTNYEKFCGSTWGGIWSPHLRQVERRAARSKDMPTLVQPLCTPHGLISGQTVGCSDSKAEHLAETQGFEPWIRL